MGAAEFSEEKDVMKYETSRSWYFAASLRELKKHNWPVFDHPDTSFTFSFDLKKTTNDIPSEKAKTMVDEINKKYDP